MPNRFVIQIYEIQDPGEAGQMVELGIDHIGSVVLSSKNWKQAGLHAVVREAQRGGARSSLILLFSDPETVFRALDYYQPDIVHFCEALVNAGNEIDQAACERLIGLQASVRSKFDGIEIQRSIPIAPQGQGHRVATLDLARMFEAYSDWLLTDTLLISDSRQPVQGYVGITGQACDWSMARRLVAASNIPVILAGGLSPENVDAAIAATRPAGVDSCTQTNATDTNGRPIRFKKDIQKVRDMVVKAKQAAGLTEKS